MIGVARAEGGRENAIDFSIAGITMPYTTHLGMVNIPVQLSIPIWGMVYYCHTRIAYPAIDIFRNRLYPRSSHHHDHLLCMGEK